MDFGLASTNLGPKTENLSLSLIANLRKISKLLLSNPDTSGLLAIKYLVFTNLLQKLIAAP